MSAKTLIIAGATLAAGVATALPVSAAPTVRQAEGLMGPSVMFNLLDRNGDGAIDKDEASALTNAIFDALDTDHNGTLSEQELRGALNHMRMGNREMGHGGEGGMGHGRMERGPANDRGHADVRRVPGTQRGNDWHGHGMEPRMGEGPQLRRWHPGAQGPMGAGPNAPQGPGPNMGQGPGPNAPQGPGPNTMGQGPGPNAPEGAGPDMMGQGPGPNAPQGAGPNAGQGGDQTAQTNVRTRMFDYLDTNGDGVISREEFDAARFPRTGSGRGR